MKLVCAWCQGLMIEAIGPARMTEVSHGICAECMTKELDKLKPPEPFPVPGWLEDKVDRIPHGAGRLVRIPQEPTQTDHFTDLGDEE